MHFNSTKLTIKMYGLYEHVSSITSCHRYMQLVNFTNGYSTYSETKEIMFLEVIIDTLIRPLKCRYCDPLAIFHFIDNAPTYFTFIVYTRPLMH